MSERRNVISSLVQKLDMQNARKFTSNIAWLLADKVFRLGVGLLVGVWVARYLGPEKFGTWNYAIAYTSLFGIIATLGLDAVVVTDLIEKRSPRSTVLGTALRLRLVGAFVGLLISTTSIWYIRRGDVEMALLVAISASVFIFQTSNVVDYLFQATSSNKHTVLAQNAAFALSSALKVIFIYIKADVVMFALASLAEAAICAIFMYAAHSRVERDADRWRYDGRLAARLLSESWPLILSGLAFMVYVRIDQIMIGGALGDGAVGVYSAAVKISEIWNFVPVAIVTAALPLVLGGAAKGNIVEQDRKLQILFDALALIGWSAALISLCASDWLVELLYGRAYGAAADVLKLSVWGVIFSGLGYASGRWLVARNLSTFILGRNLMGACVNIGLNVLLIPHFGIKGAAFATLISYIVANLLCYLFHPKTRPLFIMNIKAIFLVNLFKFLRAKHVDRAL